MPLPPSADEPSALPSSLPLAAAVAKAATSRTSPPPPSPFPFQPWQEDRPPVRQPCSPTHSPAQHTTASTTRPGFPPHHLVVCERQQTTPQLTCWPLGPRSPKIRDPNSASWTSPDRSKTQPIGRWPPAANCPIPTTSWLVAIKATSGHQPRFQYRPALMVLGHRSSNCAQDSNGPIAEAVSRPAPESRSYWAEADHPSVRDGTVATKTPQPLVLPSLDCRTTPACRTACGFNRRW